MTKYYVSYSYRINYLRTESWGTVCHEEDITTMVLSNSFFIETDKAISKQNINKFFIDEAEKRTFLKVEKSKNVTHKVKRIDITIMGIIKLEE